MQTSDVVDEMREEECGCSEVRRVRRECGELGYYVERSPIFLSEQQLSLVLLRIKCMHSC